MSKIIIGISILVGVFFDVDRSISYFSLRQIYKHISHILYPQAFGLFDFYEYGPSLMTCTRDLDLEEKRTIHLDGGFAKYSLPRKILLKSYLDTFMSAIYARFIREIDKLQVSELRGVMNSIYKTNLFVEFKLPKL